MSMSSRKNKTSLSDHEKFDIKRNELEKISKLESKELQLGLLNKLAVEGLDVNARDAIGRTFLHCASCWNSPTVVEFLLKNGADPNSKERDLSTPIHSAASAREPATTYIIKLLVQYGADPNAKSNQSDYEGKYPIQNAMKSHFGLVDKRPANAVIKSLNTY